MQCVSLAFKWEKPNPSFWSVYCLWHPPTFWCFSSFNSSEIPHPSQRPQDCLSFSFFLFYFFDFLCELLPPLSWPSLPVKCLFLISRMYVCGSRDSVFMLDTYVLLCFATFLIPSLSGLYYRLSSFSIHTACGPCGQWGGWYPASLQTGLKVWNPAVLLRSCEFHL